LAALIIYLRKIFGGRVGSRRPRRNLRGRSNRLLRATDFRREIRLERMRSDRRQIPFCVLKLELCGRNRRPAEMRRLSELVLANVRATDEKGLISRYVIGLLLVDTPEMGGRTVLDRLESLALRAGFDLRIELRTYDPDAFGDDDFDDKSRPLRGPRAIDRKSESNRVHAGHRFAESTLARLPSSPYDSDSGVGGIASRPAPLGNGERLRIDQPVAVEFVAQEGLGLGVKRVVDVFGATVGLMLGAPMIAIAMVAIRLTSAGPVIFTQLREGRGGQPFRIYKLRTMYVDAEARQAALRSQSERDGPAFKMKDDPRVTRVGKLLRSTCLDELPQLINVLRGEMSLVGPRPLPVEESRACQAWHRRRLDVLPGLTCDWQINKQSVTSFDDWMRLDLAYVDRGGIKKDLWLMLRTLRVPLARRGSD
jgi:lipopolysaccharide/colanic/teichoic acid biosynthesis glycosyltransferase